MGFRNNELLHDAGLTIAVQFVVGGAIIGIWIVMFVRIFQ